MVLRKSAKATTVMQVGLFNSRNRPGEETQQRIEKECLIARSGPSILWGAGG